MKSFSRIIFTFLFFLAFQPLFAQEYYIRFSEDRKEVINKTVTRAVSIDKLDGTTVYAYANPSELEKIKALGYDVELLPHPSSQPRSLTMATTLEQMANWDRYPTYEVYRAMMKKWEQDYPSLCKLDSIGTTVQGRKLYVLKISDNVLVDEAEPEFFYSSTMHGDETTGFYFMLRLIHYLLTNYGTDSQVTNMVDNVAIYINPNANPDGTYYTGNHTVSGSRRYNYNSKDLNRNFPDPQGVWNPDGPHQPETVAMMDYANERHFVLAANFHGGAEVANYPWDTWNTTRLHADNTWFNSISRQYATLAQNNSPAGYFNDLDNGVTHGGSWYVISGGRQDYMTYYQNCREITLEVSYEKLLPTEQLVDYWNYNREAILKFIENVYYGIRGVVTNTQGQPLAATITIANHDKDNSHVVTNPNHGNFYRMIAPGTYNVTFSAEGYYSQSHTITVSNSTSTVTKDVQLVMLPQTPLLGRVTSKETGAPIEGVKIELMGTSIPPVYTNFNGEYLYESIAEYTYQIRASKPGYLPVIKTEEVSTSNIIVGFEMVESNAESFETVIPQGFTFEGGDWFRDNSTAFDGSYSMRSAAIGNSSRTSMKITLNVTSAGNISFARKVSSELNYDKLKFYIDGVERGTWSGQMDWEEVSFEVASGTRTFEWRYEKDISVIGYSDCAWVDNITFPLTHQKVTFTALSNAAPLANASVAFNGEQIQTDASGKAVFSQATRGIGKGYTVSKSGYVAASGQVDVFYTDISCNVSLEVGNTEEFSITFVISSNGTPIDDAHVTLNEMEKGTNQEGKVSFDGLAPGTYEYLITAQGYQNVSGSIELEEDLEISINLAATDLGEIDANAFAINVWPNPFSGVLHIGFFVETPSEVGVEVFNTLGQRVAQVYNSSRCQGAIELEWSVSSIAGSMLPSGIYFVKVTVDGQTSIQKVLLR